MLCISNILEYLYSYWELHHKCPQHFAFTHTHSAQMNTLYTMKYITHTNIHTGNHFRRYNLLHAYTHSHSEVVEISNQIP